MSASEILGRVGFVMLLVGLLAASIALTVVGFTVNIWIGIALLWIFVTVWILTIALMLEP